MKESFFNILLVSRVLRNAKSMICGFFLLLFLFFLGCNSSVDSRSNTLSPEDHRALEALFSHLLFYEGGAYTLFGSKPMSFEAFSDIPEKEKQEFFSFSSHPTIKNMLNFSENWNVWERLKNQYSTPRYLLFQRNPPSFSPAEKSVFLVNITATVGILQKYYEKFKDAVGEDFDPLDIVFGIQDNSSVFWNKILAREDLFGILLGFGEENAWFYVKVKSWQEDQENRSKTGQKDAFLASLSAQTPGPNSLASFDPSFPLPGFICYAEDESLNLVRRYENERTMIKKIYRGKDLVQTTLDRLTSKDLPEDPDRLYKEKMIRELGIQNQPGD